MSRLTIFKESAQAFGCDVRASRRLGHNFAVGKAILAACSALLPMTALAQTSTYSQTNIISDGSVSATVTDSTLINPWGVSVGPAIWIDKAGSGSVAVDTDAGSAVIPAVTIPAASSSAAHGSPSGTVYNSAGTGFNLPEGGSALFLFGTLDGTIAGWNSALGTQAVTVVNNSAKASYTDIALATNATGTFLLAADFKLGTIDVFNSSFAPAELSGSFTDPYLPTGYAPFGIHNINGSIYVTYAQVGSNGFETVGAGLGYVDEFDLNGNLVQEAILQGALNAPWGMALAPAGFGSFGGDLLVGNFGDGVINAYNPTTFAYVGSLQSSTGGSLANIANPGLWEIFFGQGSTLGDPNTLYFAAGINNQKDGLFGSIGVVLAAGAPNFSFSATTPSLTITGTQVGNLTLSLAPTNGFSGPVTFSCTSSVVTCTFTPATVTLSGSPVSTSISVAVAETVPVAPAPAPPVYGYERSAVGPAAGSFHSAAGVTLALLGPVGLLTFAGLRRRSVRSVRSVRSMLAGGSLLGLLLLAAMASITGCSSSSSPAAAATMTPTPNTTNVTINATSGAITQSVTIALTAQ